MHSIALVLAHHQLVRECERPKVDPVKSFLHHMIRFEDRIGKGAQDGTFSRAMLFSKTETIEREKDNVQMYPSKAGKVADFYWVILW